MAPIYFIFVDYSKVDFVLFETVGTLRDALIRDWTLLSENQKIEMRLYLFHFIMRGGNIAPFVRERILQVIKITYLLDLCESVLNNICFLQKFVILFKI